MTHPAADAILRTEALGKTYRGGVTALRDVDFAVARGEFVAVIGRSGSGKSTLVRCMNRLIQPTAGRLLLDGRDVTRADGARLRELRQRAGMIFQHFGLVRRLTVLQNVLAGRLRLARSPLAHAASLARWFPRADRLAAMEQLELVGIDELAKKRAAELSGGQQQRVAIARVLAQQPDAILADEPIASLDPGSAEVVMSTLLRVNRERGVAVVVNLHQVDAARRFADRVVAIRDGRVVWNGPPAQLDDARAADVYRGPGREHAVSTDDTLAAPSAPLQTTADTTPCLIRD